MRRLITPVLFIMGVLLATGSPAAGRNYKHKLEEYLDAAYRLWRFNGAVLVSDHGQIILDRGYGMSNQVFGDPNIPETRFFIGSITKQFTAAAILALQEDSLLHIDDPIAKYLPDYPPEAGRRITIRELLTHTSGIPNYTDDAELIVRRSLPITPEEIIDVFKHHPLDFEPGSRFKYSNSGYVLLGKIIEVVSGQSYEAFLHHRIFKPAGMKNSGYGRRESGIPNRADGYTTSRDGRVVNALPVDFSILYSAGALYSTIEDMHRWDSLLYTEKILKKKSIESMFEPFKNNYGFGWFIESKFGRRHAYHGGFLDGFNTIVDRWLDDSLEIIVFSNEDEAPLAKIARGIAAIAFNQPVELPVRRRATSANPRKLREFEGVYKISEGAYQFVSLEDDTLYTHLRGMPLQAILPQANDTFFFSGDNNKLLIFGRDAEGKVMGLIVNDDGYGFAAAKLTGPDTADLMINRTPITLDSSFLERYAGVYEIESDYGKIGAGYLIDIRNSGSYLSASVGNDEATAIYPGSETRFFHKEADFQITFLADDQGQVAGCIIDMGGKQIHCLKIK